MRQKSTIYSPGFHNQFQETSDEIRHSKEEKSEHLWDEKRQGQSRFQLEKKIKQAGVRGPKAIDYN